MQEEIKSIEIITPDDWHLHLRRVHNQKHFPYSFSNYGKTIIMPNLENPIIKFSQAMEYYKKSLITSEYKFEPLMTLFLCEKRRRYI